MSWRARFLVSVGGPVKPAALGYWILDNRKRIWEPLLSPPTALTLSFYHGTPILPIHSLYTEGSV
jgi:hypothetical protein